MKLLNSNLKNDDNQKKGFLGVKLFENDDKQYICCYPTSFLPLKAFDAFGYKSIEITFNV